MARDVRDASRAGHASDGPPNVTGAVVRVFGSVLDSPPPPSPTQPRRSLRDSYRSSREVKWHAVA